MKKIISAALCVVFLLSSCVAVLGVSDGGIKSLEDVGLEYSEKEYTDKAGKKGKTYTFEYDPKTSDVQPYVFNYNAGWGSKVLTSANAVAAKGYNVLGGVNGDFFSMSSGSYGVLVGLGMYIADGRIHQTAVGASGKVMVFDSDGKATIVDSKLKYDMFINGEKWTEANSCPLTFINKRSDTWQNGIYLWDSCCGNKTDSTLPGLEIVCEKLDNTEISAGKTCSAKVVDVRIDSFKSEFGPNQFVLYIKNGSSYQNKAKTIKVGDVIDIAVEETIAASREAMYNANSCISLLYQLIEKGKVVSLTQIPAYTTERPRTGIGVKADGSIVVIAADGDGAGAGRSAGMTAATFAQQFLDAGCEYAFNLDGGGSTAVVVNDNGTLGDVFTQNRAVGNALLFVERKDSDAIDSALASKLDSLMDTVTDKMMKENAAIKTAYDNARSLLKKDKAMDGDYRDAIYMLNQAIGAKTKLESLVESVYELDPKKYTLTSWNLIKTSLVEAKKVLENSKSTTADYNFAYFALAGAVSSEGDLSMNVSRGKKYTRTKVWNGNYADDYYTELTDGGYGAVDYGVHWTGFHSSLKESDGFFKVTIDLGEKYEGLSKVNIQFLSDVGAGVDISPDVRILVSDKATSGFVEVAKDTSLKARKDDAGSWIRELIDAEFDLGDVSGRYVQIKIKSLGSFNFLSEIDVYMSRTLDSDPVTDDHKDLDKIVDTSKPEDESKAPETSEPEDESKAPETSKPEDESKAPETSKPEDESKAPETSKPEDESKAPETSKPEDESKAPETSKPVDESVALEESEAPTVSEDEKNDDGSKTWIIVIAVVAVVAAVASVIVFRKKK
ncbi:MAG: phosphodiester glycosidase family protein [Clostridia bacterium]|nr:phosphodiester glycosidase family protein [Clostridia bacterium]